MKRYDRTRPRWRQGLLNWLWLVWPTCPGHTMQGGPVVRCWLLRWHRGDHAFGAGFGAVRWPRAKPRIRRPFGRAATWLGPVGLAAWALRQAIEAVTS
ncbi:MAG: hypothetical protein ACRD03_02845 [Acidimicrobiales bacterium]